MNQTTDLKIFRPYHTEGLVRMGNKNDGGYIVHQPSLRLVDCLISYGVGYNTKFEEDFVAVTHKPVYAFDPTMAQLKYLLDDLKNTSVPHTILQAYNWASWKLSGKENKLKKQQIHFIQEGISGSNSEKFKTLGHHLSEHGLLNKKIFLKIDIEGAEYDVIKDPDFYTHLDNAVQILFEFHYMDKHLETLVSFLKRLESTHSLVHIHANNFGDTFEYAGAVIPHVVEATFLHNSLMPADKKPSVRTYPIAELDAPCTLRKKDLIPDFF